MPSIVDLYGTYKPRSAMPSAAPISSVESQLATAPFPKAPTQLPPVSPGLIGLTGRALGGGLGAVGNLLDLPGSSIRDALALKNPFDQWIDPLGYNAQTNRTTGRELLRQYAPDSVGKEDTWQNFWPGFAVDVLTDPTNLIGLAPLTKAGSIAKNAGIAKYAKAAGDATALREAKVLAKNQANAINAANPGAPPVSMTAKLKREMRLGASTRVTPYDIINSDPNLITERMDLWTKYGGTPELLHEPIRGYMNFRMPTFGIKGIPQRPGLGDEALYWKNKKASEPGNQAIVDWAQRNSEFIDDTGGAPPASSGTTPTPGGQTPPPTTPTVNPPGTLPPSVTSPTGTTPPPTTPGFNIVRGEKGAINILATTTAFRGISAYHDAFDKHLDNLQIGGALDDGDRLLLQSVYSASDLDFTKALVETATDASKSVTGSVKSVAPGKYKMTITPKKSLSKADKTIPVVNTVNHELFHIAFNVLRDEDPELFAAASKQILESINDGSLLNKFNITDGERSANAIPRGTEMPRSRATKPDPSKTIMMAEYFQSNPAEVFAQLGAHAATAKIPGDAIIGGNKVQTVIQKAWDKIKTYIAKITTSLAPSDPRIKALENVFEYAGGFTSKEERAQILDALKSIKVGDEIQPKAQYITPEGALLTAKTLVTRVGDKLGLVVPDDPAVLNATIELAASAERDPATGLYIAKVDEELLKKNWKKVTPDPEAPKAIDPVDVARNQADAPQPQTFTSINTGNPSRTIAAKLSRGQDIKIDDAFAMFADVPAEQHKKLWSALVKANPTVAQTAFADMKGKVAKVIDGVNNERVAGGLPPLTLSEASSADDALRPLVMGAPEVRDAGVKELVDKLRAAPGSPAPVAESLPPSVAPIAEADVPSASTTPEIPKVVDEGLAIDEPPLKPFDANERTSLRTKNVAKGVADAEIKLASFNEHLDEMDTLDGGSGKFKKELITDPEGYLIKNGYDITDTSPEQIADEAMSVARKRHADLSDALEQTTGDFYAAFKKLSAANKKAIVQGMSQEQYIRAFEGIDTKPTLGVTDKWMDDVRASKKAVEPTPTPVVKPVADTPAPPTGTTASQVIDIASERKSRPWVDAAAEDEGRWFGSRVTVEPTLTTHEDAYTGTVSRVLNGGDVVEVTRDGFPSAIRIDASRIKVDELKDAGTSAKNTVAPSTVAPSTVSAMDGGIDKAVDEISHLASPRRVAINRYIQQSRETKPTSKGKIKVGSDEANAEFYGQFAVAKYADETGKNTSKLIHVPTGLTVTGDGTNTEQKYLAKMLNDTQADFSFKDPGKIPPKTTAVLRSVVDAWKYDSYEELPDEIFDSLSKTVKISQTKDATFTLGMEHLSGSKNEKFAEKAIPLLKRFVKEIPEFAYNPVFTVNKAGKLAYQDHFKFEVPLSTLLPKGVSLKTGDTVAVNLSDIGFKKVAHPEDVIKDTLKNSGFKLTKAKGGYTATFGGQKVNVTGSDTNWTVSSDGAAGEAYALAKRNVDGIAWSQPPVTDTAITAPSSPELPPIARHAETMQALDDGGKLQAALDAYNTSKANLAAIGEAPRKPSSEKKMFGTKGIEAANPDAVAAWKANKKAYDSWNRRQSALKKAEVKASNDLYALQGLPPDYNASLASYVTGKTPQVWAAVKGFTDYMKQITPPELGEAVVDFIDRGGDLFYATAPGKALAGWFNASLLGGGNSASGRAIARAAVEQHHEADIFHRKALEPVFKILHGSGELDVDYQMRLGKTQEEAIKYVNTMNGGLLDLIEGVSVVGPGKLNSQEFSGALALLRKAYDDSWRDVESTGMKAPWMRDLEIDHNVRNQVDPSKSTVRINPKSGPVTELSLSSQIMRDPLLTDLPGGTSAINDISLDPNVSGIIHRAEFVKRNLKELDLKAKDIDYKGKKVSLREYFAAEFGERFIRPTEPNRPTPYDPQRFNPDKDTLFDGIIKWASELETKYADTQMPFFGRNILGAIATYMSNNRRTSGVVNKTLQLIGESARMKRYKGVGDRQLVAIDRIIGQDKDQLKFHNDGKAFTIIAHHLPRDIRAAYDLKIAAAATKLNDDLLTKHAAGKGDTVKVTHDRVPYELSVSKLDANGNIEELRVQSTKTERVQTNDISVGEKGIETKDIAVDTTVDLSSEPDFLKKMKEQSTAKKFFEDVGVDNDVYNDANRFMKPFTNSDEYNVFMGALKRYINVMKSNLTGPFPAFHIRNALSGLFNNAMLGLTDPRYGKFDYRRYWYPIRDAYALRNNQTFDGIMDIKGMEMPDKIVNGKLIPGVPQNPQEAMEALQSEIFQMAIVGEKMGVAAEFIGEGMENLSSAYPGMRAHINPFLGKFSPAPVGRTWLDFANPGAVRDGFTVGKEGLQTVNKDLFVGATAGKDISGFVEEISRISGYIAGRRQGMSPRAARDAINKAQIDYTKLTAVESKKLRLLIPFYTFSRHFLPMAAEELVTNPGGPMAQVIKLANRARNPGEIVPDFISQTIGLPMGENEDGTKRYLTGLGFGFEDSLNIMNGPLRLDPQETVRELLGRSNPLVKGLGEIAFGRSLFQDGPGGGRELSDMDPSVGRTLTNIHDLATGDKTQTAKPFIHPLVEFGVSNSPLSRFASTARTLTDPRKWERPEGLAMNLLTGARVSDVSPKAQNTIYLERLGQEIKRMGGRTFSRPYFSDAKEVDMTEAERVQSKLLLDEVNNVTKRLKILRESEESKKITDALSK